jgi:hypothetical protein
MMVEQVSMSAFRSIWSALHFPNEPNHCGNKVLDLFKNNAMSPFQKGLFDDLGKNKNFSIASSIIVEMENLMIGNTNLKNQVIAAIQAGINDSKIDMPPINIPSAEPSYTSTQNNDDGGVSPWTILWVILAVIKLILVMSR